MESPSWDCTSHDSSTVPVPAGSIRTGLSSRYAQRGNANRIKRLALGVMCREPINKGKAQIDVFGRTAGGHIKLPTFRQELLDRGLRSLEGQGRARVDVAANELFGG